MTKEDILRFFYTNNANLDARTIVLILTGGLFIALLICLCYYASCLAENGIGFSRKFNVSIIVTLLISVVIMLMISSNIVISLGMVGALSIVRFRTAIKDSRDTVFLFWSIAEGLSVGSQNFKLAILSTLFIGLVILCAGYLPVFSDRFMLVITGEEEAIDRQEAERILKEGTKGMRLRASNRTAQRQEFIYEVRLREKDVAGLTEALQGVSGVKAVVCTSESGESL